MNYLPGPQQVRVHSTRSSDILAKICLRQSAAGFLTVPFCRADALVKMGFEFYREH
jgi:hypothetical protein